MSSAPPRNRDLAAIHAMATKLGMDTADQNQQSEYRAMLFTVGGPTAERDGKRSASHLDHVGRARVREHLQRLVDARGGKRGHAPRGTNEWAWVDTAAEDRRPMLRKIIMQLKSANRKKAYADGIASAMFRIERLELCGMRELHSIIAALNKDAQRRRESEAAEARG